MLSWAQAFGQQFAVGLFFVIVGAGACVLAELIIPIEKQSVKSWFRGLGFWVIFVSATVAVRMVTAELFRYFGLHAAFSIDLRWVATSDRWIVVLLGYVVLPFVPWLIFDFLV